MKNKNILKKEISDFIKDNIYKNFTWQNGFSLNDLKVVSQELFNCRFKIIKIKVKDITGKYHYYNWKDYQKQYTHDWLEEAIEDISELKKAKSYITVSITKSDFEKLKFIT
jgi:hypothetical protein